ncbi:hypothetical protein M2368_000692 [Arthrobacter sp. JUb119]|nr:hypothetical protein [Arthrobacter sp. JUb119]
MPSLPGKLERLKHQLSGLGEVFIVPPAEDGYVFLRYADSQELYAFDCTFEEVLNHAVQSGGEEIWPQLEPLEAQVALFAVHVMETIETAPDKARILSFGGSGLEAAKGKLPTAAIRENEQLE